MSILLSLQFWLFNIFTAWLNISPFFKKYCTDNLKLSLASKLHFIAQRGEGKNRQVVTINFFASNYLWMAAPELRWVFRPFEWVWKLFFTKVHFSKPNRMMMPCKKFVKLVYKVVNLGDQPPIDSFKDEWLTYLILVAFWAVTVVFIDYVVFFQLTLPSSYSELNGEDLI